MKAIVNDEGLKIDFSHNAPELWIDEGEEQLALIGSEALVAIAALRQALGRCQRRIINRGFALRYIDEQKLIDPVRIARFLATENLTQSGLYEYLVAA